MQEGALAQVTLTAKEIPLCFFNKTLMPDGVDY